MSVLWHDAWRCLPGLAGGIFLLLVGYRVIPVLDDAAHKKFGLLLRIFGFAVILFGLFSAVDCCS
jgi:hypothetical protein